MKRRQPGVLPTWGVICLFVVASGLAGAQDAIITPRRGFPPGTRVEVDGKWDGEVLTADKVVQEEADRYPEIKGFYDALDLGRRELVVGPYTIEVPTSCDIDDDDEEDDSYRLGELLPEWRLKIEGEFVAPRRFRAFKIDVDRRPDELGVLEVEGYVDEERFEGTRHLIVVLGLTCEITATTEIPAGIRSKRRPIRRDDDDEARPVQQLVLFDRLTVGGEVQVDSEYEDNFNLDSGDNEDLWAAGYSMTLELLLELTDRTFAFAKGRTANAYVVNDEDKPNKDFDERTQLEELYFFWERMADQPLSIQVGRQDFDDRREWIHDENLDAARAYLDWRDFQLEYSWSNFIADPPRRRFEDRYHQILYGRWNHGADSSIGVYMIDIRDDGDADDSPFYLGVQAYGRPSRSVLYWLEYAYVDGVDGPNKIEAHGGDLGAGYQFRDLPLRPSIYAGYAFASGDGKKSGRTDRNFRQTGYEDNNDKFFGVASFRYYGELLRPELSNLHIWTVGAGIQPVRWFSVDVLYHAYRQDRRADELRDAEIGPDPNGRDRDLGQEIDLVVGFDKLWGHMDIELDVGYFIPGSGFDDDEDDPALWVAVQVEWNF